MKRWMLLAALAVGGCAHAPLCSEPSVGRYHQPGFVWAQVARLVILPVVNETAHPEAGEEVRRALHAELQQLGLFEAVPAPAEITEQVAKHVRDSGRFSEAEMVALARCGAADVILVGTLTHYSPYQRPRIGLTLQAISPDLGKVVASVDGLWDATDNDVADRAREHYRRVKTCSQFLCDRILGRWDEAYAADLVLKSPHLYQRFVASEAVRILVGMPTGRPTPASCWDDWHPSVLWQWFLALWDHGSCQPAAAPATPPAGQTPPPASAAKGKEPAQAKPPAKPPNKESTKDGPPAAPRAPE